jgi:hypothetical protein
MAETMTYDAGTDTITTEDNLNEAEQESLKVGEEMQNEQEQLLAGKYKNAEDLEKAYVELQKKMGGESSQDSETAGESSDSDDGEETSEEEEEANKDSPITSLMTDATAEFYDNDGTLSSETLDKFNEMSSRDLVNAYLEMQKNAPNPNAQEEAPDLTEADVNQVRNAAGGEAQYGKLVQWAADNLDQSDVEAFDDLVATGNVRAIKLAVSGLKAQYENANGYEGTMLSGKPPQTSKDVFRSQQEVVAAMSDPRYERDPAYRQDLVEKLDRSDVKF